MDRKYQEISRKFFSQLKNKDITHKFLIIAFFGVPGSGKTHVAKLLEERYKAVRIKGDEIADIIAKHKIARNNKDIGKIKNKYVYQLISNIPFKNKRIILDKSIDREYSKFISICKTKNIPYFLIRMKIRKEKAIERLKSKKPEEDIKNLAKKMNKWYKDFKLAWKHVKVDIILNAERPNLKKLYKELAASIPHAN